VISFGVCKMDFLLVLRPDDNESIIKNINCCVINNISALNLKSPRFASLNIPFDKGGYEIPEV
jgi:hypothetical protein